MMYNMPSSKLKVPQIGNTVICFNDDSHLNNTLTKNKPYEISDVWNSPNGLGLCVRLKGSDKPYMYKWYFRFPTTADAMKSILEDLIICKN